MNQQNTEKRRALRVAVNIPTLVEPIGQPNVALHENLQRVYQRVEADTARVGERFPGVIRDMSTNGAFIASEPLPLMSRVGFTFALEAFGQVEAVAWVLWRREDDCEVPRPDGSTLALPKGFGVLFEAIPLDARLAIHRVVSAASVA